jgi:hypothetical protein
MEKLPFVEPGFPDIRISASHHEESQMQIFILDLFLSILIIFTHTFAEAEF